MADERSDMVQTPLNCLDPLVFFREYYASLPHVPKGKTETDIRAFEDKYGKDHGYTPEQLSAIAKQARAQMRERSDSRKESQTGSPAQNPRTWGHWILGFGFGVYVLADLGVLFYAETFRGFGWNRLDLRPYVIGIVTLGIVLLVLSYGWSALRKAPLSNRTKRVFATIVLALFLLIITSAVAWVVTLILQNAGLLPLSSEKGKSERDRAPKAEKTNSPKDKSDLEVYLAARRIFLDDAATDGPADAPVTIVLFGDFQDPYSARLAGTLKTIRKKYAGKIRFAFRHYPLEFHNRARDAALAALAAQRQGKFLSYSDRLYEIGRENGLADVDFERLASNLGMDLAKFRSDLKDPVLKQRTDNDITYARDLGIRGTPTLFVNGKLITGSQKTDEYEHYIEGVLSLY